MVKLHQFMFIVMLHLQNVAIGEEIESSPPYVNLSAIKGFDVPDNNMKRLSDHEHHPRRHHRNRLVHPIKKTLETNSKNFRSSSGNYNSQLTDSTEFFTEENIKDNAQPVR